MSAHCQSCHGGRWIDVTKPATPENWEACPGCGHEAEIATLRAELDRIKEFTSELGQARFAVRDWYTLIDFLKLWREQAQEESRKKDAELATLRKVAEAAKPMLCASLDSQQRVYDIKRLSSALAAWEGVRG